MIKEGADVAVGESTKIKELRLYAALAEPSTGKLQNASRLL
jgi:hypothetical protein